MKGLSMLRCLVTLLNSLDPFKLGYEFLTFLRLNLLPPSVALFLFFLFVHFLLTDAKERLLKPFGILELTFHSCFKSLQVFLGLFLLF